ncbi:MAG: TerB family tellurite resistance protein [Opitutaceae bacterium]|nr:TerB family tellurite resistance protein [Cytophagales bacterium]
MNSELLSDYPIQEKEAYVGAIASIATVDRQATDDELDYLSALAEAAGVDQQMVETSAKDESNQLIKGQLDILRNSDLRFALITDIITFAKADGKLDQAEQEKINEISSYLGISQQQTTALNTFVEKSADLKTDDETPKDESFLEKTGLSGILKGANIPSGGILKGLLGVAAPLILARMFRNRSNGFGNQNGNPGGLLGSVFGGPNSSLGGGLGGGLLGSLLNGGGSNTGGLGSILGNLSGGRGYGGLGSILGGLFQRR